MFLTPFFYQLKKKQRTNKNNKHPFCINSILWLFKRYQFTFTSSFMAYKLSGVIDMKFPYMKFYSVTWYSLKEKIINIYRETFRKHY